MTLIYLTLMLAIGLTFNASMVFKYVYSLLFLTVSLGQIAGLNNVEVINGEIFNIFEVYLIVSLFTITIGLWSYRVSEITNCHLIQRNYFYKLFLILLFLALIVNLYILSKSYGYMFLAEVTIEEYKNESLGNEYLNSVVARPIMIFSHAVSPLGYLALIFHFVYLVGGDKKRSFIFLLLSFNVVFYTLQAFSRAAIVQYVLIYIAMSLIMYGGLNNEMKRTIKRTMLISLTVLIFFFVTISIYRFGDEGYYYVPHSAFITNPILYSLVEYASQWFGNGLYILSQYESVDLWYGKSFRPLVDRVFFPFVSDVSYSDYRIASLGVYASKFNGLVATVVYDFGFIGALFAFVIWLIGFLYAAPNQGRITLGKLMLFFYLFIPVLMFFSGNFFSYLHYNLAIVYSILYLLSTKIKVGR